MFKRTTLPQPDGPSPSLVVTTFQASLDNLLLEATKNRTMNPLRDAALSARANGFIVEDVFHTLVLACDALHTRREYRGLLMRSLSDLGKMAFLRLLPISNTVVHVVCDLVRKLLRSNTVLPKTRSSLTPSFMHRNSGASTSLGASCNLEGSVGIDQLDPELSISFSHGGETVEHPVVEDEELQMRILQTLMAFLSACAFDNDALSDIIGLLFTTYILAAPESKVEVTCAAAIEQQTLELLRNFSLGSSVDDEASLSLDFQSAAYIKDVCLVCAGNAPKWLRLGPQPPQPPKNQYHPYGNVINPPRRLRLLLLRALIAHLTQMEPMRSPSHMNIFFSQWLNEDIVPLALLRSAPDRQTTPPLFSDSVRFSDDFSDGVEEFHLTQKLIVTVLTKALPAMRHTAPAVLRQHAMLVKLSAEGDGGAEDAQRMAILLALWRRAIAEEFAVMRTLLLLETQEQQQQQTQQQQQQQHEQPRQKQIQQREEEEKEQRKKEEEPCDAAGETGEVGETGSGDANAVWTDGAQNAFVALVVAAARLLSAIAAAEENGADADAQGKNGRERHPAAGQISAVLGFLTVCAQGLARVSAELSSAEVATGKAKSTLSEVRAAFIALHPAMLRCYALAAERMLGNDVSHDILKGITHLVETACFLGLSAQRDGYLQIFSSQIFLCETHEQNQQIFSQPRQRESYDLGNVSVTTLSSASRSRQVDEPLEERTLTMHRLLSGSLSHQPLQIHKQQQQQQQQLRCRVDVLQQKLHVLNSVISVASNYGHILGDGWRSVASCLLAADSLLLRYRSAMEDYTAASQHFTVRNPPQEDEMCSAEHVRNAIHLLFIHSATAPDDTGINGLLVHYVAEVAPHTLTATTESLITFRAAGECCALALVAAAAASPLLSVDRLCRLWNAARPFFARAFDSMTLQRFLLPLAADGVAVLARLLEDVAVIMTQFCHPGLSAGGPYASAALLVRFAALNPNADDVADTITKDCARSADNDGVYSLGQLFASPAELFASAYDQLRHSAALEALLVLLREVRRLVQSVGEELHGEAWTHFLGILRQAATVSEDESHAKKEKEKQEMGTDAVPAADLITDEIVTAYSSPSETESGGGKTNHGGAGVGMTTDAPEGPASSPFSQTKTEGTTGATATAAMSTIDYEKQSISIAFRALETIQHSCITSLDDEGIRQLIRCVGAFMTHSIRDGEARLNINLSAAQLLWSVADFIVLREEARRSSDAPAGENDTCDDLLWCTLLLQLYDGCLDVRPEVRQSALKTLFSLVQTYGARLSADSWNCILRNIVVPLVDVALEAAVACATCGDVAEAPRRTQSFWYSNPTSPVGSIRDDSLSGFLDVKSRHAPVLQDHFAAFPVFFDEMRVTLMDSACRVFATHHRAMRLALQEQQQQHVSLDAPNDQAELMHVALNAFIELCATSRLVARGTNNDAPALSAVRALRALAVEAEGLLTHEEMESVWKAVEGLFWCNADGSPSSVRTECTASVTVAVVSALSEFASTTRSLAPSTSPLVSTSSTAQARDSSAVAGTSFFQQLRRVLTVPGVPEVLHISRGQQQQQQQHPHQTHYIARFLRVVQEALRAPAATDSYFFPGHVQLAVLKAWRNLWPTLDVHEQEAVLELALLQFPTPDAVSSFLSPGEMTASDGSSPAPASLRLFLPPGAHPAFLTALLHFLCAASSSSSSSSLSLSLSLRAGPGAVRAAGALLLLEYAEPQRLSARGPGAPFDPPLGFFDAAEKCFRHFLGAAAAATTTTTTATTTATITCAEGKQNAALRRAGIAAGAEMFAALVERAGIALRDIETRPASGDTAEHLTSAIGRLEGFVRMLQDLIAEVLRLSGDVEGAAELLAALVQSAVVDAPPFAGVARLSFAVLRQWSVAGSGKEKTVEKEEEEKLKNMERKEERDPLCEQVRHVARALIHARNREALQHFMANVSSREARQTAKKTLQAIILLNPTKLFETDKQSEEPEEEMENEEFETMQKIMVDLVRVVEYTGDDAEFRSLLSQAMMTVCVSFGFSGTR